MTILANDISTFFARAYPLMRIFTYTVDTLLIYDAKPHFMFLLDKAILPVLKLYLETGDRALCLKNFQVPNMQDILDRFEKLRLLGVFVPGPADFLENSAPDAVKQRLDYYWENILMRKFVLEITEQCNFRCKYCFNTLEPVFRHHTSRQMSAQTAQKSIDFYKQLYLAFFNKLSAGKKQVMLNNFAPCLGIYGGEPTLNWPIVEEAVEYYKSRDWKTEGIPDDKLEVTINTNLSCITDKILDFLVQHRVILFVSLDGPKQENDKNRVDVNDRGTFDTAYGNLIKIRDCAPEYFKNNVCILAVQADNYDADRNREFLKQIGCQVSYLPQANYDCFVKNPEDHIAEIRENMDEWIADKIVRVEELKNSDMDACLSELENLYFLDGLLTDAPQHFSRINAFLSCPMGVDNIMIGAGGDMHICHKTDGSMPFGNVHMGVDREKMEKLYRQYIDKTNSQECRSCWALHFCNCCAAIRMKSGGFINPSVCECDYFRAEAELNFRLFIELYKKDKELIDDLLIHKKDLKYYKSIVDFNEFSQM